MINQLLLMGAGTA